MIRRATPAILALLAACAGPRPTRDDDVPDAGAVPDAPARPDAPTGDLPDAGACRPARDASVPTTLTAAGRCTGLSTGRWCEGDAVLTCGTRAGEVEPLRFPCGAGERCVMRGERGACEPAGACREDATRCASATVLERCAGGAWLRADCPARCVGDGLGAACADPGATRPLAGTLRYMRRPIAANLLSWGAAVARPARGFAVHYVRGASVLARGTTDAQGRYALDAPATRAAGDQLVATAATGDEGRVTLMVGDPGLPDGNYGTFTRAAQGDAWAWRWDAPDEGATLTISEALSPGASVFDDLRAGAAAVRARLTTPPRYALAAWVRRGVEWDCGSCFSELTPVTAGGRRYDGQLWLTGEASEPWWSDAVTLHEMGHWVMGAWGAIPHEGGAHYLGVPVFPGFGWSEGWASWVSSDLRSDPRHYAVAGGTFFWWDIARREIYNGATWQRPSPAGTLLQLIDENEVSAILWSLRDDPAAGADRIYRAVATPRMTVGPFARCNTQTYYAPGGMGGTCTTGENAPHLADLLDALRCDGAPAGAVGAAAGTYPYPASAPRCEVGCAATSCTPQRSCATDAPFALRARPGDAPSRLVVELAQPGDLGVPTAVRLELPVGITRVDGPLAWTAPAHTPRVEVVTLSGGGTATVGVIAEAHAGWAGARARVSVTLPVVPAAPSPPAQPPASAASMRWNAWTPASQPGA